MTRSFLNLKPLLCGRQHWKASQAPHRRPRSPTAPRSRSRASSLLHPRIGVRFAASYAPGPGQALSRVRRRRTGAYESGASARTVTAARLLAARPTLARRADRNTLQCSSSAPFLARRRLEAARFPQRRLVAASRRADPCIRQSGRPPHRARLHVATRARPAGQSSRFPACRRPQLTIRHSTSSRKALSLQVLDIHPCPHGLARIGEPATATFTRGAATATRVGRSGAQPFCREPPGFRITGEAILLIEARFRLRGAGRSVELVACSHVVRYSPSSPLVRRLARRRHAAPGLPPPRNGSPGRFSRPDALPVHVNRCARPYEEDMRRNLGPDGNAAASRSRGPGRCQAGLGRLCWMPTAIRYLNRMPRKFSARPHPSSRQVLRRRAEARDVSGRRPARHPDLHGALRGKAQATNTSGVGRRERFHHERASTGPASACCAETEPRPCAVRATHAREHLHNAARARRAASSSSWWTTRHHPRERLGSALIPAARTCSSRASSTTAGASHESSARHPRHRSHSPVVETPSISSAVAQAARQCCGSLWRRPAHDHRRCAGYAGRHYLLAMPEVCHRGREISAGPRDCDRRSSCGRGSGPGRPELEGRSFRRFKRAADQEPTKGLGLGLWT